VILDDVWFDEPPAFRKKGAIVKFFGRTGGVSIEPYESLNASYKVGDDPEAVARNRDMVARAMGVEPKRLVTMRQVHGTRIVEANAPFAHSPLADAMYTKSLGVALCVLTADCIPLAAFDPAHKLLFMAHVGWRGALQRFPEMVVERLVKLGADVRDLLFALGPSIRECCYEVGEDLLSEFKQMGEKYKVEDYFWNRGGKLHFDLIGLAVEQLKSSGVVAENIYVSPHCTHCESDLFFSYRRDGERSGRQISCGRIVFSERGWIGG